MFMDVMSRCRKSKKSPEQEMKYLLKKYKGRKEFVRHCVAHGYPSDFAERFFEKNHKKIKFWKPKSYRPKFWNPQAAAKKKDELDRGLSW